MNYGLCMKNSSKPVWPHQNIVMLRVHAGAGQWYKQVGGKVTYFGVLRDPDAALRNYLDWATAAATNQAQRVQTKPDELTLTGGLNHFLMARQAHVTAGSLSSGQFIRYRRAVGQILDAMGRDTLFASLAPEDFARLRATIKGKSRTVGNVIRDMRVAFKWVSDHYGVHPRYGQAFKRPQSREVRGESRKRELWTPAEVRALLKHAQPNIKAMILLGLNCGFGQTDCALLPLDAISRTGHTFSRPKTGIKRLCPFWPETWKALQARHRWRPDLRPDLVFLSKYGKPLVRDDAVTNAAGDIVRAARKDAIREMFRRACVDAKVHYRPFYTLRHTFRSVADAIPDPTAIRVIMGHRLPGMDDVYVHLVGDGMKRLRVVTSAVHRWLHQTSSRTPGGSKRRRTA